MLSQVSHSSKRLGKLKKYKTKLTGSGFDFLLQSMDRDKENHVPNALPIQYGQLTRSVNIDTQPTVPTSHNNPMLMSTKPQNVYIENVKVLDCSDGSISEMSDLNNKKEEMKNYYSYKDQGKGSKVDKGERKSLKNNSGMQSKIVQRYQINTVMENKGNKFVDKDTFEALCEKVNKYLSMSSEIINSSAKNSQLSKKLKKYSQQILRLITELDSGSLDDLQATKGHYKNQKSSLFSPTATQSEDYLKTITRLQSQRQKLNNLISKHEMANIKMFVKINDGESEQIQRCKRQLSSLFNKYKELEELIKRDKKNMIMLARQKEMVEIKNKTLLSQKKELEYCIQKMRRNGCKSQGLKFFQEEDVRERNSLKPSHTRKESCQSYLENSMNQRGQLRIDSLRNSRFSNQEDPPRSSISTITERNSRGKAGSMGINLNALVEAIQQQNVKKLVEDPYKLKKVVQECRRTILNMQKIIKEQNSQLELSIRVIEENRQQLLEKDNKLKAVNTKLERLEEQLKKEKLGKVQLETLLEKQKEKIKFCRGKLGKKAVVSDGLDQSVGKEDRIRVCQGKEITVLDFVPDLKYMDEYRIIATQAQTLQKYLSQLKK